MRTVAGVCVFVVFLALIGVLVFWSTGKKLRKRSEDVHSAVEVTPSTLTAGSGRVQVFGSAIAGPQGPIPSPVSGSPVVWWNVSIKREFHNPNTYQNQNTGSGPSVGVGNDWYNDSATTHESSRQPFGVETPDGRIFVNGQVTDHSLPSTPMQLFDENTFGGRTIGGPNSAFGQLTVGGTDVRESRSESVLLQGGQVLVIGDAMQGPYGPMIGGNIRLSAESASTTAADSDRGAAKARIGLLVSAAVAAVALIVAIVGFVSS